LDLQQQTFTHLHSNVAQDLAAKYARAKAMLREQIDSNQVSRVTSKNLLFLASYRVHHAYPSLCNTPRL
jgi:hypothetical protein